MLKLNTSHIQNRALARAWRKFCFSLQHAMRFLPRNLHVFVLVSELRFCRQIVELCSTLILQDAISTVKHKALRTSKLPIFKTRVSPHSLGPFSRFAVVSCARRGLHIVNYNISRLPQDDAKTPKPLTPKNAKYACVLPFFGCKSMMITI